MIAATAGGDEGRGSRLRRVGMWLGHYEPRTTAVFFVLLLWQNIANLWLPLRLSTIITGVIGPVMLVFVAAMLCSEFVHGRNLCPRDLDDTLLDPQGAVNKNLRRLAWVHRPGAQRQHTVVGLALLAILMTSGLAYRLPWPARAMLTLVAIAGATIVGYGAVAMRTHRRLQPWCPWCRNGGHGPWSHVPVPQPVNTNAR